MQLMLLWSSSRSDTRDSTASMSSPLCPPLYTPPISSSYAKILVPVLRDFFHDAWDQSAAEIVPQSGRM